MKKRIRKLEMRLKSEIKKIVRYNVTGTICTILVPNFMKVCKKMYMYIYTHI